MSDDLLRFGTVGSPQTTPGSGTPAAIQHTHELGLDHLEIAWTRSVRVSDETCAEIKAAAEAELGVPLDRAFAWVDEHALAAASLVILRTAGPS